MGRVSEICKEISKKKAITKELFMELAKYGDIFKEGMELLISGAVKRYIFRPSGRILWIVVGKEDEYLIYDGVDYCTCMDFYIRGIIEGSIEVCQHLMAKYLAEALNLYNTIELEDELFDLFIREWKEVLRRTT